MKKSILLLSGALLPLIGMAQENVTPVLHPAEYVLMMSPNGQWLASKGGDANLVNSQTGENYYYSDTLFGLGNCVADNGTAVGDATDIAAIFFPGNPQFVIPESLSSYWFCDINAITPDATRICGIVNNPEKSEISYVPFIADMDENGNVGEPVLLPYPELDVFDMAPQFVSAVWISKDGKTVIGQVVTYFGNYAYPIYFKEEANGKWSYGLPSLSLFNPTNIEAPENPWLNEPYFPEPTDFMSGLRLDAYNAAYENWLNGGGTMPDPAEYMTEAQIEEYQKAADIYNEWFYGSETARKRYQAYMNQVISRSVAFEYNEMCLHPSGEYLYMRGGYTDENFDVYTDIYSFNTNTDEYSKIETPTTGYYPSLVLSDGTMFITKPMMDIPSSYVMLPGTNEFITVQQYFQAKQHPEVASWFDENLPAGTGVFLSNDDQTFFTAAVMPDQFGDKFDYDDPNAALYTTIYVTLGEAGVESLVADPQDGVYRAYNLQGVKVLETKDASAVNSLPAGVYILNGKKVLVK